VQFLGPHCRAPHAKRGTQIFGAALGYGYKPCCLPVVVLRPQIGHICLRRFPFSYDLKENWKTRTESEEDPKSGTYKFDSFVNDLRRQHENVSVFQCITCGPLSPWFGESQSICCLRSNPTGSCGGHKPSTEDMWQLRKRRIWFMFHLIHFQILRHFTLSYGDPES